MVGLIRHILDWLLMRFLRRYDYDNYDDWNNHV